MENVAENRPEELRLRVSRGTQRSKLFGGISDLQNGSDFLGNFAGGRAVILLAQIKPIRNAIPNISTL